VGFDILPKNIVYPELKGIEVARAFDEAVVLVTRPPTIEVLEPLRTAELPRIYTKPFQRVSTSDAPTYSENTLIYLLVKRIKSINIHEYGAAYDYTRQP